MVMDIVGLGHIRLWTQWAYPWQKDNKTVVQHCSEMHIRLWTQWAYPWQKDNKTKFSTVPRCTMCFLC